ncbi:hypothetical protein [Vibrio sonorensis]|uniref:hypothetical protein n=1 Tax=Vibrio sonorensis TaxID=1004316 RepID=UPI0008D946CE|nr:hypothetical protein [Vibrio sonorensis]
MKAWFDCEVFTLNTGCDPSSEAGLMLVEKLALTLVDFIGVPVRTSDDLKALSHGVKGVANTAGLVRLAKISLSLERYSKVVDPAYSARVLKREIESNTFLLLEHR